MNTSARASPRSSPCARTRRAHEGGVTEEAALKSAAARILQTFGRVDIHYDNAGITNPQTVLDVSVDDFRRIQDVNVTGAFLAVRAFAPTMLERGYGRIINMGSI